MPAADVACHSRGVNRSFADFERHSNRGAATSEIDMSIHHASSTYAPTEIRGETYRRSTWPSALRDLVPRAST
jgi:hypothetical protein